LQKKRTRKSLHLCGYVPIGEHRKMRVLGLPRTPKTRVVGHSSLLERHGSTNGHGTAQNGHPRMVGPVRDITNPLHASIEPELRSNRSEARLRWGVRSCWALECHSMRSSKKAFWLPVISSSGTCMGMTMQVFFLFSAFISVSIVPLSPLSFLTLWIESLTSMTFLRLFGCKLVE
jgi:hypothetical protein